MSHNEENQELDLERIQAALARDYTHRPSKATANTGPAVEPVLPQPQPFTAKTGFRLSLRTFRNIVNVVKLVAGGPTSTATFELSKGGLSYRALSKDHIFLVTFTIPPTSFQDYACASEKPVVFGVDVGKMAGVLRRANGAVAVTVEAMPDTLNVTFHDIIGSRTFNITQADSSELVPPAQVPVPSFEYTSRIWMEAGRFRSILDDVRALSSGIGFRATAEDVVFTGVDDGVESSRISVPRNDPSVLEVDSKEPASAAYPVEYLKALLTAIDSEDVVFQFRQSMPLTMKLGLGIRGGVLATCIVAPRKDDEPRQAEPDEDPAEDFDEGEDFEEGADEPVSPPAPPAKPAPAVKPKRSRSKKAGGK
jgi:DNA polymerase III sliding clamp (beta) subunit (PCNA family)